MDYDFDDFMFVISWNKLNGRIKGLRVNPQRQNIKSLTRRMNDNRLEKVKNLREERKLSYSSGRGASPL